MSDQFGDQRAFWFKFKALPHVAVLSTRQQVEAALRKGWDPQTTTARARLAPRIRQAYKLANYGNIGDISWHDITVMGFENFDRDSEPATVTV